ncbi:MAG: winged helix-turn-helix domain-containing protein [Phycisphaerales bacterium]
MGRVFEIRTAGQLRALNAPARREIVEALMDRAATDPGMSAREIADRAGLSTEATHYHLGKLMAIKIVEEVGQRRTGARPEKLFALTCDDIELTRGKRGPAFVRELVRGVRLLLRRVEREYGRASEAGAFETRPRAVRLIGWMTPAEAQRVCDLSAEAERLVRDADARARAEGLAGRERIAVTAVLAPVERAAGA